MSQKTDELAVRRSIFVRCTPEHAFHVYTERMNDWYPLEGHSLFDDPNGTVVWEGHVGGRVYERSTSGEEGVWGTIVAWDPPNRLTMTWHPGRGEETAQELDISFTAEGDGTRVDVVHSGWERIGPDFRERMAGYQEGWGTVLDIFADEAGKGGLRCTRTPPASSPPSALPTSIDRRTPSRSPAGGRGRAGIACEGSFASPHRGLSEPPRARRAARLTRPA